MLDELQLFASGLSQGANADDGSDVLRGFLHEDIFKERRRAGKLVLLFFAVSRGDLTMKFRL